MGLTELLPNYHLLRRISRVISFDLIYEILEPYYPSRGRPSLDPTSMFKMLLVGYLYGIKSERRLVREDQLNIVYRWFCGFENAELFGLLRRRTLKTARFKKPPSKTVKSAHYQQNRFRQRLHKPREKSGIGYLMETTVDCKHRLIIGVDVYSANEK